MSKAYIDYIYNKCFIERIDAPYNVMFLIEMPNGFCFAVSGGNEEICTSLAKAKIRELESYLEKDKEHYGYDLEGEYE